MLLLAKKKDVTEKEILDSLKKKDFTWSLMTRQAIKFSNASIKDMMSFSFGKIPVTMFLILPMFAFLLKLFYIRRNRLFVEHMVFTLHIHSFIFFLLAIAFCVYMFANQKDAMWVAFILQALYVFLAFKNVYKQSWIKTFIKFLGIGFFYTLVLSLGLLFNIVLSFVLFKPEVEIRKYCCGIFSLYVAFWLLIAFLFYDCYQRKMWSC